MQYSIPTWVTQAVFYQIFPDRFARSARLAKPANLEPWDSEPTTYGYKGGDLLGVLERLDYLQDLGITAIYFNPIFQSASNHRYHTHDYYQVDPLLGGNPAFEELLAACKRRGLRVVLDGVFNHASRGFFQFNDILENGRFSPWLDWFYVDLPQDDRPINAYDRTQPPGYRAWVGLHALPKFNTDNPQVREFLMRVGEHWIRQGIDGWRLDVAAEITTPGFWQEFRRRVRAINPEAYLVAEIWEECPQYLQGDQFDAVMNYPLTEALIRFVVGARTRRELVSDLGYRPWPPMNAREFADRIDALLRLYPWPVQLAQFNLLDSHDTARFLSIADGDETSLRLALLLLMTLPGVPCIYYGDEIGMTGGRPDAQARRSFPWDHPERWNHGLLAFFREAIRLRRAHPALQTGAFQRLYADDALYAFARRAPQEQLIVVINAAADPREAVLPLSGVAADRQPPYPVWGAPISHEPCAEGLRLRLAGRSAVVLAAASDATEVQR